jgi:RNA polymerase sigma-70 factor (ECF subfamily)
MSPREFDKALVRLRGRMICIATRIVRNPADAEDAVQAASIKAWKHLKSFDGRAAFSTWLHTIVTRASLDLLRRRRVALFDCPGEVPELLDCLTPEQALVDAEAIAIMRALPPTKARVLAARIEGRSYEEIAQAERCPIGTVMSRLFHGRRCLAAALKAA